MFYHVTYKSMLAPNKMCVAYSWPPGVCGKVASDIGLGGGFRRVLQFLPLVTTG